jgi:hypothetical protein
VAALSANFHNILLTAGNRHCALGVTAKGVKSFVCSIGCPVALLAE